MDVYGLVGSPVEHSLSPAMQEAGYEAVGIDARYVTCEPEGGAAGVGAAAQLGFDGLNVTVPFKQDVLSAVEPTPRAARVGAVNTVDFSTTPPTGANTDVAGVRRAFDHAGVSLDDVDAVVVGAGGAGRAATAALAESAASVHVANRTVERAETLVDEFRTAFDGEADTDGGDGAPATLSAGGLAGLTDAVPEADVLVNATSVGMESDETPVPAELLHGDLAVLDAVYTPLETRLLRDAAAAGAETVDGAWMLLFQGVEAFELWTGRDAPVDAMNEALRAGLGE